MWNRGNRHAGIDVTDGRCEVWCTSTIARQTAPQTTGCTGPKVTRCSDPQPSLVAGVRTSAMEYLLCVCLWFFIHLHGALATWIWLIDWLIDQLIDWYDSPDILFLQASVQRIVGVLLSLSCSYLTIDHNENWWLSEEKTLRVNQNAPSRVNNFRRIWLCS